MEVLVRFPDDSVLPVAGNPAASIASLKASIQWSAGVPIPLQQLVLQERELRDQDRVADCTQEVRVLISAASSFSLRLIVKEASGTAYQVCVRGRDTVWAVKRRIQELRGINAQQQRLYSEKTLLENHQTVSEAYLPGKFEWELLQPNERYLTVTTTTGSSFQVTAAQSHRVCRVVSKLRELEWFDCRHQTMSFGGKEVKSTDTLAKVEIIEPAALVCEAAFFWLWLATINASSRRLLIHPTEAILPSVSQQLPQQHTSPMWLLHRGSVLRATATPSELGLASGAIVQYGDLLVHVRSFNAEKFDIALLSHSYVAALRRTLAKRLGRNTFKLMYCGFELCDNRTFRDCGFTSEVTIELIELTDNYIWVEYRNEKVAITYDVKDVLDEFSRKTGIDLDFDVKVYDRIQYQNEKQKYAGGGILQLHQSESKEVVTVESGNTKFRLIMNKADNLGTLVNQLRPICAVVAFENVDSSELISSIGRKPLRAIVENRRFIGIRSADEVVEFIPFDPSDLVITLKERLEVHPTNTDFIYNGTLLSNSNRIGEYPIQEAEYIEACGKNELLIWEHPTNDRLFIPILSMEHTLSDLYVSCRQLISEPVLLFFKGFLPNTSERYSDWGIESGCCVHAIPNSSFASTIKVSLKPDKFIFLERCNGDIFLLSFSHSNKLEDIKVCLRRHFAISIFSLVLDSRLLTTHRFSRISTGSTVQLFTLSDGLLFHGCGSIVTPALISPTATLRTAKEMCNIPASYPLFEEKSELNQDSQVGQVGFSGVIHYAVSKWSSWTVEVMNEGTMAIILAARFNYTARDLITAIQQAECDPFLSPRIYTFGEVCGDSCSLGTSRSYSVLFPPLLLISAISQSRGKVSILAADSNTVESLRKAIAHKYRIDPRSFRILHNTELLSDETVPLSTLGFTTNNRVTILQGNEIAIILRGSRTLVEIANPTTQFLKLKWQYFAYDLAEITRTQFVYRGKVVDDNETLSDYSIDSIATLDILTKAQTLIKVNSSDGKCCDQIVQNDSLTLALLRSLVPAQVSHALYWFGELSKSQSLSNYKLENNSVVYLVKKPRKDTMKLHFFVGNHYDRSLFRVKSSGTWIVKDAIEKLPNHTSKSFESLAVASTIAEKGRRVNECGIEDGQIVHALTDDSLLITVEYELHQISFVVENTSTGTDVKARICELLDIPQEVQQLYCGKALLEDDMKAADITTERNTMTIVLLLLPEFVTIHTVQGPIALIISSATSTVAELKRRIQVKTSLNASRYRLFADDHELPDTDSISTSELASFQRLSLLKSKDVHLAIASSLCTYQLYAKKRDSVLTVLRKLQRKVGIHYSRMQLLGGMEVTDSSDVLLTQKAKSAVLSFSTKSHMS